MHGQESHTVSFTWEDSMQFIIHGPIYVPIVSYDICRILASLTLKGRL